MEGRSFCDAFASAKNNRNGICRSVGCTANYHRRARLPGAPKPAALSSECVGANPCVRPCHSRQIVLFIDTTVQTCNFAPLRGAFLSCVAKKGTKEGDLGEALRLCCGNTSTFRHYPRQPKFALPQDPLPRCAKLLHDTSRFLNCSTNFCLTGNVFQIRAAGTSFLVIRH